MLRTQKFFLSSEVRLGGRRRKAFQISFESFYLSHIPIPFERSSVFSRLNYLQVTHLTAREHVQIHLWKVRERKRKLPTAKVQVGYLICS